MSQYPEGPTYFKTIREKGKFRIEVSQYPEGPTYFKTVNPVQILPGNYVSIPRRANLLQNLEEWVF